MDNSNSINPLNVVILIADNYIDNYMHRKLLDTMGIAKKYMEFSSPAEAIGYLKIVHDLFDKSGKNSIDLIVFDMNSSRMSADEFLNQMKTVCNNEIKIQVILISEFLNDSEIKQIQSEGSVSGVIQKPLDSTKIIECFKSIPAFKQILDL
ncbi:MAG: response regulator [Bacteroidota bacterium]